MHKRKDSQHTFSNSELDTINDEKNDGQSDVDPFESHITYNINTVYSNSIKNLHNFLSDPKIINPNSDPTTNFIDRLSGKCYNIPDNKINKFFKLIGECVKENKLFAIAERQKEDSGIMLDFDIYQDDEKNQLSDAIFQDLCQKIIGILSKIITINNTNIPICITRKPSIKYNDEKNCFKDGFHLIIPSIKVSRGIKKLLIKKLVEEEIIDRVFVDVIPSKNIKTNKHRRQI